MRQYFSSHLVAAGSALVVAGVALLAPIARRLVCCKPRDTFDVLSGILRLGEASDERVKPEVAGDLTYVLGPIPQCCV